MGDERTLSSIISGHGEDSIVPPASNARRGMDSDDVDDAACDGIENDNRVVEVDDENADDIRNDGVAGATPDAKGEAVEVIDVDDNSEETTSMPGMTAGTTAASAPRPRIAVRPAARPRLPPMPEGVRRRGVAAVEEERQGTFGRWETPTIADLPSNGGGRWRRGRSKGSTRTPFVR